MLLRHGANETHRDVAGKTLSAYARDWLRVPDGTTGKAKGETEAASKDE